MATPRIYSTRFLATTLSTGTLVYNVPMGNVAVLRDLDAVWRGGPTSGTLNLINAAGGYIFTYTATMLSDPMGVWRGRQVFDEGELVLVVTDSPFDVTLSGYLLVK